MSDCLSVLSSSLTLIATQVFLERQIKETMAEYKNEIIQGVESLMQGKYSTNESRHHCVPLNATMTDKLIKLLDNDDFKREISGKV